MNRFRRILFAVDSEKPEKMAMERAVSLADNNQAHLTVVTVAPPNRVFSEIPGLTDPGELETALLHERKLALDALVDPYRGRIEIETRVLQGTPFLQIIREVLRNQHDLLIKSPDRQEFLDRLYGGDDMHLLRKCPCPVWLIKNRSPGTYGCILAAVDVDEFFPPSEIENRRKLNQTILELASSLAVADFAELHIGHAWNTPGEGIMRGAFMQASREQVADYVEKIRRQRDNALSALLRRVSSGPAGKALEYLKPQTHLLKGWARKEIPLLATKLGADLVVMGTVARTGIPGLIMGNTAETILNQIDCSVLAVKPPGFTTPVTLDD